MQVRPPWKTVLSLLGIVLVSTATAVAGLALTRALIPPQILRETNDVAGNYLQTIGTIYAVLLAFVVFVVWTQFNDARTYVEREASEVMDLFRTATGLPADRRAQVHAGLARYVARVLDSEWYAMSHTRGDGGPVFDEVSQILDHVWRALVDFDPKTERDTILYQEVLQRFNDLSDVRTNRLTSSRLKIPLALRILLYMAAVVTVGSMYLFAVDRWLVHAIMTAAMAGALSHVLYIIRDLDDCFDGDWQVSPAAFERVRAYIERTQPPGGA